MEAITHTGSKLLPSLPRSSKARGRRRSEAVVMGAIKRSNSYGSGRQVDENMIVLRKRIHQMNVIERNYDPPSDWMDWEKQIYVTYDDIICRALGVVQTQLMETRPSVAIAALLLLGATVPTSFLLFINIIMHFAKAATAGIQGM